MKFGVYRKVQVSGRGGGGGVGELYQLVCVSRDHYTGIHNVTYIPLRIEPEWAGTIRNCHILRSEFERMFEYVGEGLPEKL